MCIAHNLQNYYKVLENPKWANPDYIPPDEMTITVLKEAGNNRIMSLMFEEFFDYHHGLCDKPELKKYLDMISTTFS